MSSRYGFSLFVKSVGRLTTLNRQIPKSPTGKVLRRALQDGYEQKKDRAVTNKSKL